jgi:hypothetical protein
MTTKLWFSKIFPVLEHASEFNAHTCFENLNGERAVYLLQISFTESVILGVTES